VRTDNFGQPDVTDYRNPGIAEAMKNLGFAQRFGLSIPLAQDALNRNGNPLAEFAATGSDVLATIRKRP